MGELIERFRPAETKPADTPPRQNPDRWVETAPLRIAVKDKIAELMHEANALKAAAAGQKVADNFHLIDTDLLRKIMERIEEYSSLPKDSRVAQMDVLDHLTFAELVSRVDEVNPDAAEFLERAVLGGDHVTSLSRRRYREAQQVSKAAVASDLRDAGDEDIDAFLDHALPKE